MPVRSPDDRVVRDSRAGLWSAAADGILSSEDFTADWKLRSNLSPILPTPSPTNWSAVVTPFSRQIHPLDKNLPFRPSNTPLVNSHVVRERLLKVELHDQENRANNQMERDALLRQFVALGKKVEKMLENGE